MVLTAQGSFSCVSKSNKFVEFVGDGLQDDDWMRALQTAYGVTHLGRLQNEWLEWVKQGSPPRSQLAGSSSGPRSETALGLASIANGRQRPEPNLNHRPGRDTPDPPAKLSQAPQSTTVPSSS